MARAIPDHTPGRLTYYALAVLLSGLALALTLLLEPLMERSIFLLFIAAIVVSALYGGLGPGLVAVFLSTSASGLFFVTPRYTLLVGLVRLGVFLLVMTAITWLAARRTRVEERLRESEERFVLTRSPLLRPGRHCHYVFSRHLAAHALAQTLSVDSCTPSGSPRRSFPVRWAVCIPNYVSNKDPWGSKPKAGLQGLSSGRPALPSVYSAVVLCL